MIRIYPPRQVEAFLLYYLSKAFFDFHCGVDVVGDFEEIVRIAILVDKFSRMGGLFSAFSLRRF